VACAHVRRFQMPRTDLDVIPYRAASVDARLSRLLRRLFLAIKIDMATSWLILVMRSCVRVRTNTDDDVTGLWRRLKNRERELCH
jgi:hypothetical protein